MRLSLDELTQLEIAHKKAKSIKEADKIKCVLSWGKGYDWSLIKEILLISDGTIKNYIDAYKNGGLKELSKSRYDGHNHKLKKQEEETLCQYVDRYNVLSSAQACQYVKNRFGKTYTENGMTRTLKRLGFSYKKPKRAPAKWDSYTETFFKLAYYMKSYELPADESIYFMDASGFEHNAKIDYGWSRKGKNKIVKTNTGRKRLNVNGAYDIKKHKLISICQEGNVNSESNLALIKKVIALNPDKKKITIILDNASMNKSKEIFDFVRLQNESETKIELMYTPPYSPHLNLIERLWKFIKKKLLANRFYSSYMKFKTAIEDFLDKKMTKFKTELKTLMTENFQKVAVLGKLQI